jgi:hypothetical protein
MHGALMFLFKLKINNTLMFLLFFENRIVGSVEYVLKLYDYLFTYHHLQTLLHSLLSLQLHFFLA